MSLFFTDRSGIGDDLMVFWAAAAAAMTEVVSPRLALFFENPVSRNFLQKLSPIFPELDLLTSLQNSSRLVVVRPKSVEFRGQGFGTLLRRRLTGKNIYCDPYVHKCRSEFGSKWEPERSERLALKLGLLQIWHGPYDETYDGWQQLSIGLGFDCGKAARVAGALAPAWPEISKRLGRWLPNKHKTSDLSLFLPSGGSFQDFGKDFVSLLRNVRPDLKIARYRDETQPADIYFESLEELSQLIFNARLVVTNDSVTSHLAQFFSKNHVLISTRARPGNIIFPGCANTRVVDLGSNLECRPCAYHPLGTTEKCPAGFARCRAQLEVGPDGMELLRQALR